MPSTLRDNALDALLQPLSSGLVGSGLSRQLQGDTPSDVLFLRAREGASFQAWRQGGFACTQPFKPEVDGLQRIGANLIDEDALPAAAFPLVLMLPPRQREEARALLAKACLAVAPGGTVIASVANDEGAKSREADLRLLGGDLNVTSKHHCRVFWTRPEAAFDPDLCAHWARADAPRVVQSAAVPGGAFHTRPGVFAWDRVDAASALLAAALPDDLRGRVADFGAGWGFLAMQVLARCPQVASLDLYEADARALALAATNLGDARVPVQRHWHDVTRGVGERFDAIVCNPPFHALGRGDRPDIGRAFIAAAAEALNPGGRLWLVANRHLPYEQALADGFAEVAIVAQQGGFKIVRAIKATLMPARAPVAGRQPRHAPAKSPR